MTRLAKFVLLTLLVSLPVSAIAAPSGNYGNVYGMQPSDSAPHGGEPQGRSDEPSPKVRALLELRQEALELQAADGGALLPEHVSYLQNKIDAIQAKYPNDPPFLGKPANDKPAGQ